MSTVTVSPKYQIVIPRDVRKLMKIQPGQKLEVMVDDGLLVAVPVKDIRELRGFMKGIDTTVPRDEEDRV